MTLLCNCCWKELAGIGYRTNPCRHLFCAQCAKDSFTLGRACPYCSLELVKGDVCEVLVGARVTSASALDDSITYVLSDQSDWSEILSNMSKIHIETNEVFKILMTQLLIQLQQKECSLRNLKEQFDQYRSSCADHSDQMNVQLQHAKEETNVAEELIAKREQQLQESHSRLQEQERQCSAWERAYTALRDQISGSAATECKRTASNISTTSTTSRRLQGNSESGPGTSKTQDVNYLPFNGAVSGKTNSAFQSRKQRESVKKSTKSFCSSDRASSSFFSP